jgi:hypothetical protein
MSLELIDAAAPGPKAAIIDVGGGTSSLVDELRSMCPIRAIVPGLTVARFGRGSPAVCQSRQERFGPDGRSEDRDVAFLPHELDVSCPVRP